MTVVASRELRNQTRQLLDRAAAGEEITISVDGREVAALVPIARAPRFMPRAQFLRLFDGHQADPALTDKLRDMMPDTTDDIPLD